MSTLRLTGERTLPGIPRENYWFQRHIAAYRHAATLLYGTVVDAGCGEGYGAALLARRSRVAGIDLDAEVVAHASRAYADVAFVRADVGWLPLRDGSVDGVVALQVVEHLTDARTFVAAARRALTRGGALVVTTPNRATFPAGQNPWHTREYDAEELRALLTDSFDDVELVGVEHGPILALVERMIGEPLQHRLVRTPWVDIPRWVRAVLGRLRAGAFRTTSDAHHALDLVGIGRVSR